MPHRCRTWVRCTPLALAVAAQGFAVSSGSAQTIFHDDWSRTPAGQLPDSVKVLQGSAHVATHGGRKVIRVLPTGRNFQWTVLEFRLNDVLPDDFTIEFDLHAPLGTSYPVEIRAGLAGDPLGFLGAGARESRVVANCSVIQTGVYGSYETTLTKRQEHRDTSGVHRCRVAVNGNRMSVEYHEASVERTGVDFKRSRRLVMVVPADPQMEAHIGPLTVTGARSLSGPVAISGPITSAPPLISASSSATSTGTPSTSEPASSSATGGTLSSTGPLVAVAPMGALATEAKQLFDAGASVASAAAQLRSKYQSSTGELASVFYGVGYTPNAIAGWLSSEGQTVQQASTTLWTAVPTSAAQRVAVIAEAVYRAYPTQAAQLYTAMNAAGSPLTAVVQGVKNGQASLQTQAAALFAMPAISPVTSAHALKEAYQVEPAQMVSLLKMTGLPADVMLETLLDPYNLPIDAAITMIGTAVPARAVLAAARKATQFTMESAFRLLYTAGHGAEAAAIAVHEEFQPTAAAFAGNIRTAVGGLANVMTNQVQLRVVAIVAKVAIFGSATADDVAVRSAAIGTAGVTAITTLVTAGFSMAQVVGGLAEIGLTAVDIADLGRRSGQQASAIVTALLAQFPQPAAQVPTFVTATLRGGGFTTLQVATVLKNQQNQTAMQTATLLMSAGAPLAEVRDSLVATFNLTLAQAVQLLGSLGFN